jgi:hypothetical protein
MTAQGKGCQVSHCTFHDKVLDCRDSPIKWNDYVATIENRVRWCSVSHHRGIRCQALHFTRVHLANVLKALGSVSAAL